MGPGPHGGPKIARRETEKIFWRDQDPTSSAALLGFTPVAGINILKYFARADSVSGAG
jgi:hypothetical protein